MKITESQLQKIVNEEVEQVLQEILPALIKFGGAALRGARIAKKVAGKARQAVGDAIGGASDTKMASKQADANKVLQSLNKSPEMMKNLDKPAEVEDLLVNILGSTQIDSKTIDSVLSKVRAKTNQAAARQQKDLVTKLAKATGGQAKSDNIQNQAGIQATAKRSDSFTKTLDMYDED